MYLFLLHKLKSSSSISYLHVLIALGRIAPPSLLFILPFICIVASCNATNHGLGEIEMVNFASYDQRKSIAVIDSMFRGDLWYLLWVTLFVRTCYSTSDDFKASHFKRSMNRHWWQWINLEKSNSTVCLVLLLKKYLIKIFECFNLSLIPAHPFTYLLTLLLDYEYQYTLSPIQVYPQTLFLEKMAVGLRYLYEY